MKATININIKKVKGISIENLENKSEIDRNQINEAGKKMLIDLTNGIKQFYKKKKVDIEVSFEVL